MMYSLWATLPVIGVWVVLALDTITPKQSDTDARNVIIALRSNHTH